MAESVDARLLGELAVVVIRAQHLSDRSKIGKHHPYVVLKYGNTKTKTPVVKKGGQHPTFDAEVRFKITEDAEDIVDRPDTNDGDSTKARKSRRIPKNKSMVVTVFADDPKEPKLVGETVVDLTAVFEKCEYDDMFEMKYKDMFAGEIYLEMTYFINDAPPIPKKVSKPVSWMDYGTTGPLPPGPARHSSLESRPFDPALYPAGPANLAAEFAPRRGSLSGSIGAFNQGGIQPGAYVPPPTFPGRNVSQNPTVGPPRISYGAASGGPSTAGPARIVPSSGWPAMADSYPHRHSLTGAIPQHGTWQHDPVAAHVQMPGSAALAAPAIQDAYGLPPTGSLYPVHAPQVPFNPALGYPAPPTTQYTATIPPSSSFPHMQDMAAALPPLQPPPPVEMPIGRSTPSPMWPGGPPGVPNVVPMAYAYAPTPSPMTSFHNAPQPAAPTYPYESGHLQELARPSSTNIPIYPLIDNRPSSSMGIPQPPDRPYSTTSTHYPSAVTSSFHISSMPVNSALSNSSNLPAHMQYGGPVPPSNASTAYPGEAMRYPPPPSRNDGQANQILPTSLSYPETAGHHQPQAYTSAYPPAPPTQPGPSSAWISSEPDSRPGRNYLRSLGVGEGASAQPPSLIRSPSPMAPPSTYTDQRNYSDPTSSWTSPPYPQNYASGGYDDTRPSGFIPPNDNQNPNHYGLQNYYNSPAHQASAAGY
ncbi:hypothetical protein QFC22_000295 [Naganishia vaughanmartiniae]|uniref:Uncharacterized protein n=1 Tax=Naganishia vaughanmartiniae TaxID=1424756 RepID=A0ACC2XQP4_9TREE|nr:hypothetical protein QFC22_000295 [Naganishia vaughanmartiniae]